MSTVTRDEVHEAERLKRRVFEEFDFTFSHNGVGGTLDPASERQHTIPRQIQVCHRDASESSVFDENDAQEPVRVEAPSGDLRVDIRHISGTAVPGDTCVQAFSITAHGLGEGTMKWYEVPLGVLLVTG